MDTEKSWGGAVVAIRIPWNKYEFAILIDACIKVDRNLLSKENAVSKVSADLRTMAVSRGYEIDDIFRNENGISMQMTIMSALLQNKPSGLHNASKLFSEIRDIYINDNDAYTQILKEAKAMINGKEDAKMLFIKYIKEKASKKADDIVFAIDKISEFAIATKVLNDSVYNNLTLETISTLRKKVVNNKFFIVKNKKFMKTMQQALGLLNDFVLSSLTPDNMKNIHSEQHGDRGNKQLQFNAVEESHDDGFDSSGRMEMTEFEHSPFKDKKTFSLDEIKNIEDLTFASPNNITVFGKIIEVSSWANMFVVFLSEVNARHSFFIDNLYKTNIHNSNKRFVKEDDIRSLRKPMKIPSTEYYVETYIQALGLLKAMYRFCQELQIKSDKIFICYKGFLNCKANSAHIQTIYDFYNWMINSQILFSTMARQHCSELYSCDIYAQEHSVGTGKLYTADTKAEACENISLLLNDTDFQAYNKISHNAPMAALQRYREYLNGDDINEQLNLDTIEESYDDIDFDKYQKILLNEYNKGFRLNDKLSLKRLRLQWQRYYNEELEYDNDTICKHIAHITIRHRDMAYLPQSLLDEDTKERLLSYIKTAFESGKDVIYYEALYKEFADNFSSRRINNVEMLKTYLSYINDGNMYLNRSYIAASRNVTVDHADEVRSYMISYGSAITIDELTIALSHLPEDIIKRIISGNNSKEFVRNKKGEFFHADIVDLSQHELDLITKWISLSIADKDYMDDKELVDNIKQKLPAIMERYPFLTEYGLRDAIAYKLQDTFSFKGKIISALGQELSTKKVFADFASSNAHFTLTQLNALKNDLNTSIHFDAVYQNSLRINKEEFVSQEQAKFDVSATDSAIDHFCQGEYVSIKEISLFGAFPDAGFPWNEFLLQHYVANYSKSYKLLHAGFTAGYAVGAIVKRTSQLNAFEEVITKVLADSGIALNSEDALQYLNDSGFLARRSFGNIEAVLIKANQQRINKGE